MNRINSILKKIKGFLTVSELDELGIKALTGEIPPREYVEESAILKGEPNPYMEELKTTNFLVTTKSDDNGEDWVRVADIINILRVQASLIEDKAFAWHFEHLAKQFQDRTRKDK